MGCVSHAASTASVSNVRGQQAVAATPHRQPVRPSGCQLSLSRLPGCLCHTALLVQLQVAVTPDRVAAKGVASGGREVSGHATLWMCCGSQLVLQSTDACQRMLGFTKLYVCCNQEPWPAVTQASAGTHLSGVAARRCSKAVRALKRGLVASQAACAVMQAVTAWQAGSNQAAGRTVRRAGLWGVSCLQLIISSGSVRSDVAPSPAAAQHMCLKPC